MKLTIGMASYNNFTEVFFTVQSLRLYHNLKDTEILVVDNFGGDPNLEHFCKANKITYVKCTEKNGSAYPKQKVFENASGEYVMCIDSHVLLKPGALENLPEGDDLYHGPLMYDDTVTLTCEWKPVWRGNMWGIWGDCMRKVPDAPFEIWGTGTGLIYSKKSSWLGYNPKFYGFGGEEGYIHEKYRKAGRKVWCWPTFVWMHMFNRKIPYPLNMIDRVINYVIGFQELGLDLAPVAEHFGKALFDKALIEVQKR